MIEYMWVMHHKLSVVNYVKVVVLRSKFVSLPGKGKDAPKAMVKTLGATQVQYPGHPFRPCFEPRENGTRTEVGTALAGVWHAERVRHLKTGAADLHWGSAGDKQVSNHQQNWRLELWSVNVSVKHLRSIKYGVWSAWVLFVSLYRLSKSMYMFDKSYSNF